MTKHFYHLLALCGTVGMLPNFASAQEYIRPASIHTELQTKGAERRFQSVSEAKGAGMLELPFVDDFSADRFIGNSQGHTVLWTDRYATRNKGLAVNPPTISVASLDGADQNGLPYDFAPGTGPADTLTSAPIDLNYSADDDPGLSFYFQPKGNAFFGPSAPTDSLTLEFYAPELDQWFRVWATLDVSDPENFTFVYIPITDELYLKEGFRFRFRNVAYLQGVFSVWNLDYVWLDLNAVNNAPINNDVAFVRPEHTLLQDYTAIPLSHFAADPPSRMRSDISVLLHNLNNGPRTLEGNEIRILHDGTVVATLPNDNSPAIQAGQTLEYQHTVNAPPNDFVYNPGLDDEHLTYEVEILHGVSDFELTASNDTLHFTQDFYTHYAYDDGSAEAGYGVSGTGGRAALRYTNFLSDSVWALQIYTMPYGQDFSDTPFTIVLWEDNGGQPGTIIAEASQIVTYGEESYQESIIYKFDEPVFIPSGSFFAGYRQSNQDDGITVGLDFNTAGDQDRLYFNDGGGWTPTVLAAQASLMIRPMFTTPGYEDLISGTRNLRPTRVGLFPNPASTVLYTDLDPGMPMDVSVFDLSGRKVLERRAHVGALDVSSLPQGFYVLRIEGRDMPVVTGKFAIAR